MSNLPPRGVDPRAYLLARKHSLTEQLSEVDGLLARKVGTDVGGPTSPHLRPSETPAIWPVEYGPMEREFLFHTTREEIDQQLWFYSLWYGG